VSRPKPALQIAVLAAAALVASSAHAATPVQCPARTIGPGSLRKGGDAGARCLLAAYRHGCRTARYTLASYGVDTVAVEIFRTRRLAGGRCDVDVEQTNRIVPQPAHMVDRHTCNRLRATAGDVVADRCAPAATVSLTKP
jgi:hypothetical protein